MRHFKFFAIPDEVKANAAKIDVMQESVMSVGVAITGKAFSAVDLTAACLMRINETEPYLNAFIWLNESALSDAATIDAEIADGHRRGPLHGVPVAIKDNMNLAGTRTTAGYAGFASDNRVIDPVVGALNGFDLIPSHDATLVTKLKEAGAIIIGKSNLPDFGLDGLRAQSSHNGDTLNVYDPCFAPGASSTGSATAVAAGMGIVGIGTDTAGSILFPASAQSLVGLKPSLGLVPTDGVYPGLFNHDVAGPIGKTVADVAVVMDVIANRKADQVPYVKALEAGAFAGKRIGLFEPGIWSAGLHPLVEQHYARMVEIVKGLGAETVAVVFGDTDWQQRWVSRKAFSQCNAYLAGVDVYLASLGGNNPSSRSDFEYRAGFGIGLGNTAPLYNLLANPAINVKIDSSEISEVVEQAKALSEYYERIMTDKQIAALLMPRSSQPLPNLDGNTLQYLSDQIVGTEVNELGLPVITVPAGYLADGRPIAIDIVGSKRFSEAEILSLAFDFEAETGLRKTPVIRV